MSPSPLPLIPYSHKMDLVLSIVPLSEPEFSHHGNSWGKRQWFHMTKLQRHSVPASSLPSCPLKGKNSQWDVKL